MYDELAVAAMCQRVRQPRWRQTARGAARIVLHEYQRAGFARHAINFSRLGFSIDTSPTGAGKTYIAAALAQALNLPLLIVCPVTVRMVWEKIAAEFDIRIVDIITCDTLAGIRGRAVNHPWLTRTDEQRTVVTRRRYGPPVTTRRTFTSFAPAPRLRLCLRDGLLIVVDEAHRAKNHTSAIYKAVKALVTCTRPTGTSSILLMSATLVDKRVQGLALMRLLGLFQDTHLYRFNFGQGNKLKGLHELRDASLAIVAGDSAKTALVHRLLARRITNSVIAKDVAFNIFTQVLVPVLTATSNNEAQGVAMKDVKNVLATLTPAARAQYSGALTRLNTLIRLPRNVAFGAGAAGDTFSAIAKAMQQLCCAKLEEMVRLVRRRLRVQPTSKVVIFVEFHKAVDFMLAALKDFVPLEFTGRIPPKRRAAIVAAFQVQSLAHRVLVANPVCGGLGISLHDTTGRFPRTLYFCPSYKINDQQQAMGRHARTGTVGMATTQMVYGPSGTAEKRLLKSLFNKGRVMQDVLSAQTGTIFANQFESMDYSTLDPPFAAADACTMAVQPFMEAWARR